MFRDVCPPMVIEFNLTHGEIEMTAATRGGKRVGYVRVSSVDQNEGRQLDGVEVDKTFTDKASGKDETPTVTGCARLPEGG
jgi:hypothetical protein